MQNVESRIWIGNVLTHYMKYNIKLKEKAMTKREYTLYYLNQFYAFKIKQDREVIEVHNTLGYDNVEDFKEEVNTDYCDGVVDIFPEYEKDAEGMLTDYLDESFELISTPADVADYLENKIYHHTHDSVHLTAVHSYEDALEQLPEYKLVLDDIDPYYWNHIRDKF